MGDFDNVEAPSVDAKIRGYGDVVVYDVIDSEINMLLLRRGYGDVIEGGKWGLAGGKLELNEDSEDGAYREMYEEAGDVIDRTEIKYIADFTNFGGSVSYVYMAKWNGIEPSLSNEHNTGDWFSVHELPEIAFDGEDRLMDLFKIIEKELETLI